jgi:hypothetical protein
MATCNPSWLKMIAPAGIEKLAVLRGMWSSAVH